MKQFKDITSLSFLAMSMKRFQIKKAFLYFIIGFSTCLILGYLSHDLTSGVRIGLGVGVGTAIGAGLSKQN